MKETTVLKLYCVVLTLACLFTGQAQNTATAANTEIHEPVPAMAPPMPVRCKYYFHISHSITLN